MRSLPLSSFPYRLSLRTTARLAARAAEALRPHVPVLRLAVLFVLAFLLAFYLDARNANAHDPTASAQSDLSEGAAATPDTPVRRLPNHSAPLVERRRLNL